MEDKPLVSIITPSLNQGQFIEDTILSIKNQTYSHIEHIIIDGGSTDNTLEILKKYESTYNMRWIAEPDEGQTDAINKGFKMAKGEILAWLNSDDIYIDISAISSIVNLLERHPDADVITAGGVLMSEDGHWIQPIEVREKYICHKHLRYRDTVLQPATFFKRYVWEKEKLDISLTYAFDWDFFIRVSKHFNILPVNCLIAGYRMYGINKTAAGGAKRAKELLEVTGRYLGKRVWQYYTVSLFYVLYCLGEKLPGGVNRPLSQILKKFSMIVNLVTFKRVTGV